MTTKDELRCPRCGGLDQQDLSAVRRWTGVAITAGSALAVAILAASPAPVWALPAAGAGLLVGLVTLLGAGRARYCPKCHVRMQPPQE